MDAGIGFRSSDESEETVHNRQWADGCEMQITRRPLIPNTDCVPTPSSVVVLVLIKLDCSILHFGTNVLPLETQCEKSEAHYLLVSECLT